MLYLINHILFHITLYMEEKIEKHDNTLDRKFILK